MKKLLCFMLTLLVSVTALSGCSGSDKSAETEDDSSKEKVVVALWGNQMLDTYAE